MASLRLIQEMAFLMAAGLMHLTDRIAAVPEIQGRVMASLRLIQEMAFLMAPAGNVFLFVKKGDRPFVDRLPSLYYAQEAEEYFKAAIVFRKVKQL
ncbi:hypothetical protein ACFL2I_06175, partial [Candidatus Omnitrophota bacterium]